MPPDNTRDPERAPLLQHNTPYQNGNSHPPSPTKLSFNPSGDASNPREWSPRAKGLQVAQIFLLALLCPMASSIFGPAIDEIATSFSAPQHTVLLGQSCFMFGLGTAPLLLAPLSETFGRRPLFVGCLAAFTALQVPIALAPDVVTFVVFRALAGVVGSVGVANGGGSIFDMFETRARAKVLGVYLTGPLLGPSLGPLIGGTMVGRMHWRWIFWMLFLVSGGVTLMIYFFLGETNPTVILQQRRKELQGEHPDVKYEVEGVGDQTVLQKVGQNCTRAIRILVTQPIVTTMSLYQALIFSSLYSLYAQYSTLWSAPPYNFSKTQIGLAFLGPITGFLITAAISVAFIDKVYAYFARKNHDDGRPEYRLPLANIGAVLLPISLFWFGWAVEMGLPWQVPILATVFFGASQVSVFNPVQTYYIDAYGSNAASALAAGAFLRSILGGASPLFVGKLFSILGYGWGTSVFGFLAVLLMPAPLLFQKYGQTIREKYPFKG